MDVNSSNLETLPPKERVFQLLHQHRDLWNDPNSKVVQIMGSLAKAADEGPAPSRILESYGRWAYQRPFDYQGAQLVRRYNPYHSSCLEVLTDVSVGLGFRTPEENPASEMPVQPKVGASSKIDDVLDPLSSGQGFADLLTSAVSNHHEFGVGYLEIVREAPSSQAPIVGIHWVPSPHLYVMPEPSGRRHLDGYLSSPLPITSTVTGVAPAVEGSSQRHHAPFGWLEAYLDSLGLTGSPEAANVSEVIDLRVPLTGNLFYPMPRWLGGTAHMEVAQMSLQNEFDHFYNRGIPEMLLLFLGERISNDTWGKIEESIMSTVGPGGQGKTVALNVDGDMDNMKVQVEKLESDRSEGESRFLQASQDAAHAIVSAHGVHPSLANIQLPRSPGTANELVMATWFFQRVRIQREQHRILRRCAMTLGNPRCNGGLGLTPDDFVDALRTVMDGVDMSAMNGMARMREPIAGSGRDPADGTLSRGEDRGRRASGPQRIA